MTWKKVSQSIIGATVKRSIISKDGRRIMNQGEIISQSLIHTLLADNIETVSINPLNIEGIIEFQLEGIMKTSTQPLFWEAYIEALRDTKIFFTLLRHEVYEYPSYLIDSFNRMLESLTDDNDFIKNIYSIDGTEDELIRHSINVGVLLHITKHNKSLSYLEVDPIQGLLHDIGKTMSIPSILYKRGRLTDSEKEHVKEHTSQGKQILNKLQITDKNLINATLLHHEFLNGSGYPFGLSEKQIPTHIQLLTIVDIFDALRSQRSYRGKVTLEEVNNQLIQQSKMGKINNNLTTIIISEFGGI